MTDAANRQGGYCQCHAGKECWLCKADELGHPANDVHESNIEAIGKVSHAVEFQVVEEDLTPVLSRKSAEMMELITVNYANFKLLSAN